MPHAAVSPYEAGAWENPSWWWSEVKKGPLLHDLPLQEVLPSCALVQRFRVDESDIPRECALHPGFLFEFVGLIDCWNVHWSGEHRLWRSKAH